MTTLQPASGRQVARRDFEENAADGPALGSDADLVSAEIVAEAVEHGALRPERELSLARDVEREELALWQTLLSYRPALDLLHERLTPSSPIVSELRVLCGLRHGSGARASEAGEESLSELAQRAGWEMREQDADRTLLAQAVERVRHAFQGRRKHAAFVARVELARARHTHAKNRFVQANMPLVVAMARRFDRGLLPIEDLIQEGHLGLMRAVERFDHRRGNRFSTYAGWWIRHGFHRAIADKARLVRIPVHTYDDARRLSRVAGVARAKEGREPSEGELAERAGVSTQRLGFLLEHARTLVPLSLDARRFADGETTYGDTLPSESAVMGDEALDAGTAEARVASLMRVLSPMEVDIIRARFGLEDQDELSLRELGERYHLSRERIRQIQEAALHKMRSELGRQLGTWELDDEG